MPPSRMQTSRVVVILYAFVATAHVMAAASGPASLIWATAPLLMPLLAGVVIFAAAELGQRPGRWVLAGLGLATGADLMSLPGQNGLRAALVAGCLICFAAAHASARRWPGPISGIGLVLPAAAAVLFSGGPGTAATLAYVVGQVLFVTGWIRSTGPTVRVPEPRSEAEALTRR